MPAPSERMAKTQQGGQSLLGLAASPFQVRALSGYPSVQFGGSGSEHTESADSSQLPGPVDVQPGHPSVPLPRIELFVNVSIPVPAAPELINAPFPELLLI